MATENRRHVTDVRALRALANPIRYRLFGHLMAVGAQTASECAPVVGASPSNCSYHLRELERFGLVERAGGPDGDASADGRDKRWRTTGTGFQFGPNEGEPATPSQAAVSRDLLHAGIDHAAALTHAAADAHDEQPVDWRGAESLATYGLQVTPAELKTLTSAVDAVLRPYIALTRSDPPAGARLVHVVFDAYLHPNLGPES